MADPVSWLMIERGWKVLAADGEGAGKVEDVLGDKEADIFDGLAVATSLLGKPRYLPAERVTEIRDGEVHVSLTREQVEELGESP